MTYRVMRVSTQPGTHKPSAVIELPLLHRRVDESERFRPFPKKSFEEDLAQALFVLLIPIVVADALFHASSRGLWFDEILTLFISSQSNLTGMWNLLIHGVTSHPPTFYMIEHVMRGLGGNERITMRLVSIASFLCVMACMFIFTRKRVGDLIAVISTSALLLTLLYNFYAFEARPYQLMVACIAIALLSYERANSWAGAVIFIASLTLATSLNFYAGFAFLPFGLAELTYLATHKKFRLQIWAGFLVGVLPYIPFWPLLHIQQVLFGVHSFAAPTLHALAGSIAELLRQETILSCVAFGVLLIYVMHLALSGEIGQRQTSPPGLGFSLSDVALTVGFLLIPIVTYVAAKIFNGALAGRYVLVTALGICLALSVVLSRLKKAGVILVGVFIFCSFATQEVAFGRNELKPREVELRNPIQLPSQVATNMKVPLVICNGINFLQYWHQSSDDIKPNLFFLADSKEQYAASGSETTTIQMWTLTYQPLLNVETFPDFASNHRKFLVYSTGDDQDFWPRWLVQRGYTLKVVSVDPPSHGVLGDGGRILPKAILYFVDLDERK